MKVVILFYLNIFFRLQQVIVQIPEGHYFHRGRIHYEAIMPLCCTQSSLKRMCLGREIFAML